MRLDEAEIRRILAQCAADAPPGSWLTGITVVTASEEITGDVDRLDGNVAVISTTSGQRTVPVPEIVNVLLHAESAGPE